MGFIKRAWLSVSRRKGKSLLLLAIVFVLSNAIAGAVSIRQAATNVEKQVKIRLGGAATIKMDWKKYEEAQKNASDSKEVTAEKPSLDLLKQIGQSAYVDYFEYGTNANLFSDKVETWLPQNMENNRDEHGIFSAAKRFTVRGTNLSGDHLQKMLQNELKAEFTDAKGQVFSSEDIDKGLPKAMISKELAEKNHLHVGDSLILVSKVYDEHSISSMSNEDNQQSNVAQEPYAQQELILKIVGILQEKNEEKSQSDRQQQSMDEHMQAEKKNTILVPNAVVEQEIKFYNEKNRELLIKNNVELYSEMEDASIAYSNHYMLKSPEDAVAFKEETQALLPEFYTVQAATDSYDSIAGPIRSVSKMATYVLFASIGATVLIITLVILLFLRDRKHELGIYMSLGEKKGKVIGQIMIEVMMVALIAVSVSVFTGNMLAGGLSKSMIQKQVEADQLSQDDAMYYDDSSRLNPQIEQADVIEQYQVSLSGDSVALIYGISLGTVLIATVVPMVYIVRLKPRKILM